MESFLGDLYIIWQVRLNSSDFAAVANRRRMYGICLLREEALGRFGSLDNVIPLFFRTRESFGALACSVLGFSGFNVLRHW